MKFLQTASLAALIGLASTVQAQDRDLFFVFKDSTLPYFCYAAVPMDGSMVQETLHRDYLAPGVDGVIRTQGESLWVNLHDSQGRSTQYNVWDRNNDGMSDHVRQSFPSGLYIDLYDNNFDGRFELK